MFDYLPLGLDKHSYTFCYINGRKQINRVYNSREIAKSKMYEICDKERLAIVKVWNDNHDKTYFTDNGAEFHINRVF